MKLFGLKFFYVGLVIIVLTLLFIAWHVLSRYSVYKKINASNISFNMPQKIKPIPDFMGEKLELGYANFILPLKSIPKISVKSEGWACIFEEEDLQIIIIRPLQTDPSIFDKYFMKSNTTILENTRETSMQFSKLKSEISENNLGASLYRDYRWIAYCLYSNPKSLMEISLLNKNRFKLYDSMMSIKGITYGHKNYELLETEKLNSIIFSENIQDQNSIVADLWSKNGKISQHIKIGSNSIEKSKEIMIKIISKFQYNSEEIPEEAVVKKMIVDAMQKYQPK